MNFLISEETLKKVLSYLISRPHGEVDGIISLLKKISIVKEVVNEDDESSPKVDDVKL